MGLVAVETPVASQVLVVDGVLSDPEAYRADALARPYQSYVLDGATFHGIALASPDLAEWAVAQWPHCRPTLSFFRKSPAGQREPNYVHSDRSMGDWTVLLYLTPEPAEGDGTTFWEHRATHERESTASTLSDYAAEGVAWTDLTRWQPWHQVEARFNRLVLFPSAFYHSRSLIENYGEGDSARLVQVMFGGY